MTQTHILNFFSGSIHSGGILKTLSRFASRYKNSYFPSQNVWLSRLYFDILTSKEKQCLTVDTRAINDLGPRKFRTSADIGQEQTCYYNRGKSDTHFNSYFAKRRLTSQPFDIRFSIVKVAASLNKLDVGNISIDTELKNIFGGTTNNKLMEETLVVEDPRLKVKEENLVEMEQKEPEVSEKSQDFSQDNKIVNRQKIRYIATRIKYSTTRTKSRKFLSNITYTGISKEDFYSENFILDVYVLLTKNSIRFRSVES